MQNHYKTLGVNSSATAAELRRAYRILARRYHPDVNPGKSSEDRFKEIAAAYQILNEPNRRRQYDIELESYQRSQLKPEFQRYFEQMQRAARLKTGSQTAGQTTARPEQKKSASAQTKPKGIMESASIALRTRLTEIQAWHSATCLKLKQSIPQLRRRNKDVYTSRVSIIEASVSFHDAIYGAKKTIEIVEGNRTRKVSIQIPPGVRNGSVVRLRAKNNGAEDLVIVTRIPFNPYVSIQSKGIVLEVPITVNEAVSGANITVPTLDDQFVIRIPPGTQSGHEVRLKGRGINFKDGSRGDLFIRLMVHVPQAVAAVGIVQKAKELEEYYDSPVRKELPKTILDL